jgi:hypothetical protein
LFVIMFVTRAKEGLVYLGYLANLAMTTELKYIAQYKYLYHV